jgi:hypothetical protein
LLISKQIQDIFVAFNVLVNYKIFLKHKDNRAMIKDLELQIVNWFYQPKSNNYDLFMLEKHILRILEPT